MARTLPYLWLDVFAPEPLSGNQLCVFPDADELDFALMQKVVRELNHSETTFLQRTVLPNADTRVRILIPSVQGATEVPFAGHPLLGSACAAALGQTGPSTVTLETGIGPVAVSVTPVGDGVWEARMAQPVPVIVRTIPQMISLALALGIGPDDFLTDAPIEAVDNGMQTVLVPVASLRAVQQAEPDRPALQKILGRDGGSVLLFALEPTEPENQVHCRVFSPFDLVPEDPATGSAVGPLGEYLVRHGLVAGSVIRSEQGDEIGRPSRLTTTVERSGDETTAVYVSGRVHLIGRGEFRLR